MRYFSEIERLKRKARAAYHAAEEIAASASCGRGLLEDISHTYASNKRTYEECMARLRQIDPTCPGYTGEEREIEVH